MRTFQFTAPDAASALAQIQRQLGPEAVVLSVRPRPVRGPARLWAKKTIEVVAGLPEDQSEASAPTHFSLASPSVDSTIFPIHGEAPVASSHSWRSVAWLEAMGLLPDYAALLQARLDRQFAAAPTSLDEEWKAVSAGLGSYWKTPAPLEDGLAPRPHVFVGPPGCGKTTVLCKWLTLAVLTEERAARVWRLDGSSANTSEFLDVHCEMLGLPVERFWSAPTDGAGLWFVDLPGVEAQDTAAVTATLAQLTVLPKPRVHLVLNAAYEVSTLLAQWRAFAALEPEDLIFTHLDEEPRRVKLWNFVIGTGCGIRFLSAGQKVPGEFSIAAPELLFPRESRC